MAFEGGEEDVLDELLDAGWGSVGGRARFERFHVACVEPVGHFDEQPGHILG